MNAAKLLVQLARQAADGRQSALTVKKLYVLSGLEAEAHREQMFEGAGASGSPASSPASSGAAAAAGGASKQDIAAATEASMRTILSSDTRAADRELDAPWRGAEAYHFWLLAQKQLYLGNVEEAVRTALRLGEYDDVLPPERLHALVALTACYASMYGVCSRAFIRLEALPQGEVAEQYRKLALSIFIRNPPHDPKPPLTLPCGKCGAAVSEFDARCPECSRLQPVCVVTGTAVLPSDRVMACGACKHVGMHDAMRRLAACPLCHQVLPHAARPAAAPAAAAAAAVTSAASSAGASAAGLQGADAVAVPVARQQRPGSKPSATSPR